MPALMESTPKSLIAAGVQIVADDFGLTPATNEGIAYCLKNGLVNSAALMANGKAFADAVENINPPTDGLPPFRLGVHLTLVGEKPLVGNNPLPKNHRSFFIRYLLGGIKLAGVEKELRAQIEKCLAAGLQPSFLNSHQHLHLLPGVLAVVIKLAREYEILSVRIVNEPIVWSSKKLFRKLQLVFLNFLSRRARDKLAAAGLTYNHWFIGFVNAGHLQSADLALALMLKQRYPEQKIELGCHPGFEDEYVRNKYRHWGYQWREEIRVLEIGE